MYYGAKISSENKPEIFYETIQPLWSSLKEDRLIFVQPRFSLQDDIKEYSFGIGYRHLLESKRIFLGANSFSDYQSQQDHYQLGFGGEVVGEIAEARINTYWALSEKQLIAETETYLEYEEALNGLDVEIGLPIPHLPWAKIFGSGYFYNADHNPDIYGWKTRFEIKLFRWMTIDLGTQNDNQIEQEWFAQFEVHLPTDAAFNTKPTPVAERMLDLVERKFSPTTERWRDQKQFLVSGYLKDQNGKALSNARVEIHSEVVVTFTDESGYFSTSITPGSHTLFVYSSDGRLLYSGSFHTNGDPTLNLSMTIHDPELNETSESEDSQPSTDSSQPPTDKVPSPTPPPTAPPAPPQNNSPTISNLLSNPSLMNSPPYKSDITFDVHDPDGDDITYTIHITAGPPPQGLITPPTSGTITGGSGSVSTKYQPTGQTPDGVFTITVQIDDGRGGTDTEFLDVRLEREKKKK